MSVAAAGIIAVLMGNGPAAELPAAVSVAPAIIIAMAQAIEFFIARPFMYCRIGGHLPLSECADHCEGRRPRPRHTIDAHSQEKISAKSARYERMLTRTVYELSL
jgi:hypothetical protein